MAGSAWPVLFHSAALSSHQSLVDLAAKDRGRRVGVAGNDFAYGLGQLSVERLVGSGFPD